MKIVYSKEFIKGENTVDIIEYLKSNKDVFITYFVNSPFISFEVRLIAKETDATVIDTKRTDSGILYTITNKYVNYDFYVKYNDSLNNKLILENCYYYKKAGSLGVTELHSSRGIASIRDFISKNDMYELAKVTYME